MVITSVHTELTSTMLIYLFNLSVASGDLKQPGWSRRTPLWPGGLLGGKLEVSSANGCLTQIDRELEMCPTYLKFNWQNAFLGQCHWYVIYITNEKLPVSEEEHNLPKLSTLDNTTTVLERRVNFIFLFIREALRNNLSWSW